MVDMGFGVTDITTALENENFCFGKALRLLLNGLDDKRTDTDLDQTRRFNRHCHKRVTWHGVLTGESEFEHYRQRALASLGLVVDVLDLGMAAGSTSNACFWLSLAAGLARCEQNVLRQALPAKHAAIVLLEQLRQPNGLEQCIASGVPRSALGLLAESLRHYFCAGPTAVLLRANIKDKIYAAFALMQEGKQRTVQVYERWVAKLARNEYADELVVLAVALELSLRLVIVPLTPPSATAPWAIPTYCPREAPQDGSRTIHLGNNDVHYVYLQASPPGPARENL